MDDDPDAALADGTAPDPAGSDGTEAEEGDDAAPRETREPQVEAEPPKASEPQEEGEPVADAKPSEASEPQEEGEPEADAKPPKASEPQEEGEPEADAKPPQSDQARKAEPEISLPDLKARRRELDLRAEKLRKRRDELNLGSHHHAKARNELNDRVKQLMAQARELREKRDEINAIVVEGREERKALLDEATKQREAFRQVKRARRPRGPTSSQLRQQLQELELKQQTTVLSTAKERELLEKMAALQQQIQRIDADLEQDPELAAARDAYRTAQKRYREAQRAMQKLRAEAQEAHETMTATLDEGYSLRRKAHAEQKEFVHCKEEADDVHRRYIEAIRELQDLSKRLSARRRASVSPRSVRETQANAEALFQKFLTGDKLTTEQLMVIQKAGLL